MSHYRTPDGRWHWPRIWADAREIVDEYEEKDQILSTTDLVIELLGGDGDYNRRLTSAITYKANRPGTDYIEHGIKPVRRYHRNDKRRRGWDWINIEKEEARNAGC